MELIDRDALLRKIYDLKSERMITKPEDELNLIYKCLDDARVIVDTRDTELRYTIRDLVKSGSSKIHICKIIQDHFKKYGITMYALECKNYMEKVIDEMREAGEIE